MVGIRYEFNDDEVMYIKNMLEEPDVIRGFFKLVNEKPKSLDNFIDEASINGVKRTMDRFERYIEKLKRS